jgi:hypothetical protein
MLQKTIHYIENEYSERVRRGPRASCINNYTAHWRFVFFTFSLQLIGQKRSRISGPPLGRWQGCQRSPRGVLRGPLLLALLTAQQGPSRSRPLWRARKSRPMIRYVFNRLPKPRPHLLAVRKCCITTFALSWIFQL